MFSDEEETLNMPSLLDALRLADVTRSFAPSDASVSYYCTEMSVRDASRGLDEVVVERQRVPKKSKHQDY